MRQGTASHWETGKAPQRTNRKSGHLFHRASGKRERMEACSRHPASRGVTMNRLGGLFVYALLVFDESRARADETIVIEGRAPDEAARDRDRALGDAPFVTVLHPDEHPATASVADAIA